MHPRLRYDVAKAHRQVRQIRERHEGRERETSETRSGTFFGIVEVDEEILHLRQEYVVDVAHDVHVRLRKRRLRHKVKQ